eukprot:1198554-Pleurochrysis_carterae.AAC.1
MRTRFAAHRLAARHNRTGTAHTADSLRCPSPGVPTARPTNAAALLAEQRRIANICVGAATKLRAADFNSR